MLHCRVNDYELAYLEVGAGAPLVCVHGTLGDFRVWSPVLGPLSRRRRVLSLSLRHCFPEHWDGAGDDYTIAQHVADVIGFIEAVATGPVDLMGHSRGGHIAFRVAQLRPDLLRRLVLAEPGGDLDATLTPGGAAAVSASFGARYAATAERVAAGDIDGALTMFAENLGGPGAWASVAAAVRQSWRDNAGTLLGQRNEQRQPSRGPMPRRFACRRCSWAARRPAAHCPRCCGRLRRTWGVRVWRPFPAPGTSCSRTIRPGSAPRCWGSWTDESGGLLLPGAPRTALT